MTPNFQKLLIVSLSAPTEVGINGGAQIYILNLAKELVLQGKEVTIIAKNEVRNGISYPQEELIQGVHIKRVGKGSFKLLSLLYWVRTHAKSYDLTLENMMQHPLMLPWFINTRKRFAVLKHHFLGDASVEVLGRLKGLINIFNERVSIPFYRCPFMVPSDVTASYLKRNSNSLNLPIFINPPGIDLLPFSAEKSKRPLVVYTGTLNINRKKVDDLIVAFKNVYKSIPDSELWICGEGPSKSSLMEMASGLPVKFLGYVSDEEKIEIYNKAWVFASPSLIEGFGITWIEAGFYKLPVVVYDIGLNTVNEQCAKLVEIGYIEQLSNQLIRLLNNESLRESMGEAGHKNALQYTWKANADRFLEWSNNFKYVV